MQPRKIYALAACILLALASDISVLAKARKAPADSTTIQFSHLHGFYGQPFELSLTTPKGRIYYTTNGSIPTLASGQLYQRPLKIGSTVVVRAAAIDGDTMIGSPKAMTYIFTADELNQT